MKIKNVLLYIFLTIISLILISQLDISDTARIALNSVVISLASMFIIEEITEKNKK